MAIGHYGRAIALPVPTPVPPQFIVDHVERTTGDGLRSELPAAIDAGLKGKLGSLAMATVSHRLRAQAKALRDLSVSLGPRDS